jgi:hypothetical protein
MSDAALEKAVAEFVGAFEVVFRYDWEYTAAVMTGMVMDDANFIEPGLKDENSDWGARGALLEKYRALVTLMKSKGLKPEFPFPLEGLDGFRGIVW